MSIDLISENHKVVFEDAFCNAKNSIKIISPFIEKNAVQIWLDAIEKNQSLNCTLITKFSDKDFICGANSLDTLKNLINNGVEVLAVRNLHTKLYLFDETVAITGSANFTTGGFSRNVELSVKFEDDDEQIILLHNYFDNLYKWINDGTNKYQVTIEMIDKKALELEKYKQIKQDIQDLPNDSFGANVKENTSSNFDNLTGVLKFEYESNNRAASDEHYYPSKFDNFYFTCSPYNPKWPQRPTMLSKDKLLFMTIMSQDSNGNDAPMIVGRARTYGFDDNNIANELMVGQHDWTEHFSYYVKLYNIEVMNANIKEGISLYDLIDKTPIPGWKQASYRELADETTNYINELLENKFNKFGIDEDLFLDSKFQADLL